MLLRHTGTCTTGKTVDFLGRRITNKGDHFEIHSTAATPTTYYKKPTYSRRHQQLATPGATTSTSTPEQEELLDKQKTCPIQTLGRKATMALIHTTWPELCSKAVGSLLTATYSSGQAASPTLPTLSGRHSNSQICDTTSNTTHFNKQGTTWPERAHGRRLGRLSPYTREHNRFRDSILGCNSALWIPYTSSRSTLISREWVLRHWHKSNRSTTPQEFPWRSSYKQNQSQDTHGQLVRHASESPREANTLNWGTCSSNTSSTTVSLWYTRSTPSTIQLIYWQSMLQEKCYNGTCTKRAYVRQRAEERYSCNSFTMVAEERYSYRGSTR